MTAMPRPITKLTDEQRRLLDAVVEKAKQARSVDQEAWDLALEARNAGVPDEMLCDESGLSRSTLNRKYGPRREAGDS